MKDGKILKRCISAFFALFAIIFGTTWKKNGFCLGDVIMNGLGLPAWSNGTNGTHYAAVAALVMLLAAFGLFASTTEKKDITLRPLFIGTIVVIAVFNFLALMRFLCPSIN